MAIFVTFKTKDTMKSFFILLSLYYFLVVNVVSADSVTFPSRVEIVMDEDFDLPGGPGNAHRSIPSATPFLAFLNDDHSIDLEFYQSILNYIAFIFVLLRFDIFLKTIKKYYLLFCYTFFQASVYSVIFFGNSQPRYRVYLFSCVTIFLLEVLGAYLNRKKY